MQPRPTATFSFFAVDTGTRIGNFSGKSFRNFPLNTQMTDKGISSGSLCFVFQDFVSFCYCGFTDIFQKIFLVDAKIFCSMTEVCCWAGWGSTLASIRTCIVLNLFFPLIRKSKDFMWITPYFPRVTESRIRHCMLVLPRVSLHPSI